MKIDFFSNYKINVSFEMDDKEYEGKLFICSNSVPKVTIYTDEVAILFSEEKYIADKVLCREKNSKRYFVIYNVSLNKGSLYYKYLTTGNDDHDDYNSIKINLTGLTAWQGGAGDYQFIEGEFRLDISLDKFQSSFLFNDTDYKIRNDRSVSYKVVDKEKYSLMIEDYIIIESYKEISLKEAKKISFKIEKLFSILTGVALSTRSIVFIQTETSKYKSMFFPIGLYEKEPLEDFHSAVTNYYEITDKNQWDGILRNFFSKKIFEDIGNSFPYLLYHNSMAWEYDVFSVMAAFEKCCQLYQSKKSHKLDGKIYNDLKKNIKDSFDNYVSNKGLLETDKDVIESIREGIDNIKNTSVVSLDKKIKIFLDSFSHEVKEIFDFSEEEVRLVKKIRNAIAHGTSYTPSSGNEDITKEITIKNKLIVVISFTLLKELGLPDKQIVNSLYHGFNYIVMLSNLNKRAIDVFLNEI